VAVTLRCTIPGRRYNNPSFLTGSLPRAETLRRRFKVSGPFSAFGFPS